MLPANVGRSDFPTLTTNTNQNTQAGSSTNGTGSSPKNYFSDPDPNGLSDPTSLTERTCRLSVSDQATNDSLPSREQLGGKGMFLQRMAAIKLPVPPFKCVSARVMNALEQHPLDSHRLARYLPGIVFEPEAGWSLIKIREHLNTSPPSEKNKRDKWLEGLTQFIVSSDFYEQVKDSEAACHIRNLRCQLEEQSTSQPVIIRSSGIIEDNYGDAQAGKYLSEVQGEEDVLRTCLKVMASGYRPEVCPGVIPPPMALIIQQCIDCRYGGVAMSFQSFQDDTIRVEYTPGQPRGVVAGQSGNTPHRIDISGEEGAESVQYFPGTVSNQFILQKNTDNNGYSETIIYESDTPSDDGGQRLSGDMISALRDMVTKLEDLLLCPVDVEFAIDHQGRLFLLQVRPITRLSGGMDFAMSVPEDSLANGEAVSEGYCTGPIWLANKQEADTVTHGAIVLAQHAEEWMLESGFLMRAGGFVIAEGGFNDHVAILMRQEKKPLMLAGGKHKSIVAQNGQQVTLACARFNSKSGAFIVAGDITEKLASHRSLASAVSDLPLTKAFPSRDDLSPPEGTFCQVASGFQWLTDQNARLLSFFASGGGLDCLANPIKLSMSPQRSKLLAETSDNVSRLIHGAEALLKGYRAFLLLAGDNSPPKVKRLLKELPQLNNRFELLKKTIRSHSKSIILPIQASEDGLLSRGMFRSWMAGCHQLQSCLQALNPERAEKVQSVHELIFALHQRFVEALAPITLASRQGRIFTKKDITYVDCTTPGVLGEKSPLLRPSGKEYMEGLGLSGIVISMDEASIVNLNLGSHVGLIELLEHAEGGKGRTLRLTFSDKFDRPGDDGKSGKLRRMWFLGQLLKEIKLDKNTDNMKLGCNAVAGEMTVECSRMTSPKIMQDAFEKLIKVLRAMYNLDRQFGNKPIFEGGQWDFNLLAQRLNRDVATEADRFAFQHCLFLMSYRSGGGWYTSAACRSLLSKHHQQFIRHARRLGECQWSVFLREKPEDSLREMLMSDAISEDTRRELLHHFLLLNPKSATRLVEQVYGLGNQCFVINPSYRYRLEFYAPPGPSFGDHKEKVMNALRKHGLEYASQRVRNDKDFVLHAISEHPLELQYLSEKLRDHRDIVVAAVEKYPWALRYASERLRTDKDIIRMAIADSIDTLSFASEKVLSDREYMLDLIAKNARAFIYVASGLKDDTAFIEAAKQRNPEVLEYAASSANKV